MCTAYIKFAVAAEVRQAGLAVNVTIENTTDVWHTNRNRILPNTVATIAYWKMSIEGRRTYAWMLIRRRVRGVNLIPINQASVRTHINLAISGTNANTIVPTGNRREIQTTGINQATLPIIEALPGIIRDRGANPNAAIWINYLEDLLPINRQIINPIGEPPNHVHAEDKILKYISDNIIPNFRGQNIIINITANNDSCLICQLKFIYFVNRHRNITIRYSSGERYDFPRHQSRAIRTIPIIRQINTDLTRGGGMGLYSPQGDAHTSGNRAGLIMHTYSAIPKEKSAKAESSETVGKADKGAPPSARQRRGAGTHAAKSQSTGGKAPQSGTPTQHKAMTLSQCRGNKLFLTAGEIDACKKIESSIEIAEKPLKLDPPKREPNYHKGLPEDANDLVLDSTANAPSAEEGGKAIGGAIIAVGVVPRNVWNMTTSWEKPINRGSLLLSFLRLLDFF